MACVVHPMVVPKRRFPCKKAAKVKAVTWFFLWHVMTSNL